MVAFIIEAVFHFMKMRGKMWSNVNQLWLLKLFRQLLSGAPNENIVHLNLNIALLNVDTGIFLSPKNFSSGRIS